MMISNVNNICFNGLFTKKPKVIVQQDRNQSQINSRWHDYVKSLKYSKKSLMPDDHRRFYKYSLPLEFQIYRHEHGFWYKYTSTNKMFYPYKIHVYADKESDFQALMLTVGKFLIENNINFKTLSENVSVDDLNQNKLQKGKVITIYPHSADEFARLAKNIEFIISNNKLKTRKSSIAGDRKLGKTGRLFYRYELSSGRFKDELLNLSRETDRNLYAQRYEANRGGDYYLANDMTERDDPWYNFKP